MDLIALDEGSAALESRWNLRDCVIERLSGGELNDVMKVTLPTGTYVLRVSRPGKTREAIGFEHRVMKTLAESGLPVPAPVSGTNGSTVQIWQGRLLTLMPFVEGSAANPSLATHRRLAAGLLARIHVISRQVLGEESRPDERGLAEERWWAWRELRHFFHAHRAELRLEDFVWSVLDDEIEELDTRLSALLEGHPKAVIHGDFNPRNILVAADLRPTVVDWDDCRFDWTEWELAQGVGHFGGKDLRVADQFVHDYEVAGGPTSPQTRRVIPLFMRCGAVNEVFWALDEVDGESALHPNAARMLAEVAKSAIELRKFEKQFSER